MIKIEVIVHDEVADDEDVEELLSKLRHQVKYASGMGSFSVSLIEWGRMWDES